MKKVENLFFYLESFYYICCIKKQKNKMENFTKTKATNFLNKLLPTLDLTQGDENLRQICRKSMLEQFIHTQGLIEFINWKMNRVISQHK